MLHTYYFSASDTTQRIVGAIADNIGMQTEHHNLTSPGASEPATPAEEDMALFAAPVYAGRIPAIAAEKFKTISGAGRKCVAVVVYGNRDYDDALLELCDLLTANGFSVVAAAAFVARHSIFPNVAANRPDAADMAKIAEFSALVSESLTKGSVLDADAVKGNRPYKNPMPVPLHPRVNKERCGECGACARECPAGAIPADNPRETDADKCISCSRCIVICPEGARRFGGLKYAAIAPLFKQKCSRRCEPEWFIAE